MALDYTVKVDADVSSFITDIKAALKGWGEIEKINDKEVTVKLNYDGNFSEYRNIIQKVTNQSPDVTVKFIYDMNKQALEEKKKELANFSKTNLSITTDGDNKQAFDELENQLEQFYKEYNALAKKEGGKELGQINFTIGKNLNPNFEADINKYSDALKTRIKIIGSLYNELQKKMPAGSAVDAINDRFDEDKKHIWTKLDPNNNAIEVLNSFTDQAVNNGDLVYSKLVAQVKEAVDALSTEDARLSTIVGNINSNIDKLNKGSSSAKKKKTATTETTATGGGTGSGNGTGNDTGNGTGGGANSDGTTVPTEKTFKVNADTSDFDAKIANVNEKLDGIPTEKTVEIRIDSNTAENDIDTLQRGLGGIDASPTAETAKTNTDTATETVKVNVTDASADITKLKEAYEQAMDMASKLNQETATVKIDADATDFFATASTVEDKMDDLTRLDEIKVKSDAKDTLSTFKKIEKVQQSLDSGIPINVPIELGSTAQFKKELKEFGKTQSVKVEVTPNLSKQALKEIASQIEAKIGTQKQTGKSKKTKDTNATSTQKSDAAYQKQQRAIYKAHVEALKENDAFNEYKQLTGKSLNPDNGSFVKQLNAYKKQQEQAQKELKRQAEEVQAEVIKENEAFQEYIQLTGTSPAINGGSYIEQLANKKKELAEAEKKLKDSDQAQALNAVNKSAKKLDNKSTNNLTDSAKAQIRQIQEQIEKVNATPLDLNSKEQTEQLKELNQQVVDLLAELQTAESKKGNAIKLGSLQEELSETIGQYSGMTPALREQYTSLLGNITNAMKDGADTSQADVQNFVLQAKALNSELKITGQDTTSFLGTVSDRLKGVNAQFIAQYLSLQDFIRYVRTAADTVIQLDSALTELRKVSDASTERLNQSFEKSAQTAKELGATVSDVINMTAD